MSHYDTDPASPASKSDLAVAAATLARGADAFPFALVPAGYQLKSIERLFEEPIRRRNTVTLRTVASFLDYFKAFVVADAHLPAFYLSERATGLKVSVVFNGLTWADSSATLSLGLSPELNRWLGLQLSGLVRQKDFAQFIEDNLPDIVEPQGAKLLEICRSFRATQTVRFASSVDLSNGDVGLEYITETKAGTTDAKSRLQMPETIVLGIPLFEGEERIKLRARVRYEIEDGRLRLGLSFPQLEAALDAASDDIIARLGKSLPKIVFMNGNMPPVAPIEFQTR